MPYFFIFFIFFSAFTQTKSTTRTQVLMGTFASITLEAAHHKEISEGFRYLKKIESVLSSYQSTALLAQLNVKRKVPMNPMLKDILLKSKMYHMKTQGYFDISVGSVTKALYHFGEEEEIPTQKQLHQAILGINNIHVDDRNIRIKGSITLDLGGIGKGYAVDSLASLYATKNIKKGKIALSGDIRCLSACEVAIQSPFEEDKIIATLKSKIPNLSISTSGTYRRYVKEKKYHHLINPKTKTQGRAFVSVTVMANANNTLCDVMATAISAMPIDEALEFVQSQKIFAYILVTPEAKIIKGNLKKFIEFK